MKINKKTGILIGAILFLVSLIAWEVRPGGKSEKNVEIATTVQDARQESQDSKTVQNVQEEPAAKADATLSFDQATVEVRTGNDFDLVARINPGSNVDKGINAAQIDLTFDPAVLEVSSVTAYEPFVQMSEPRIDNEKGTLSAVFFIGGSQVKETSNVVKLMFHAKAAGNNSAVSFAPSAEVAVADGQGSMVTGTRTGTTVNVSE